MVRSGVGEGVGVGEKITVGVGDGEAAAEAEGSGDIVIDGIGAVEADGAGLIEGITEAAGDCAMVKVAVAINDPTAMIANIRNINLFEIFPNFIVTSSDDSKWMDSSSTLWELSFRIVKIDQHAFSLLTHYENQVCAA